ncbi:Hypothetical protein DEACI_3095 [Acididesulfobacillus acetoxydans]|uniref:Uncharacterized protein n=1 Tax=Acididesulfobacillus acetoxydans TaxID=1561005 RepID=A0A8S0X075_9FIRM|nr:Hypothetical protein DEACI_3095 [Acididesulfobacillus acetoxydans]CEJ08344.1 Hypothetical protein DEACI_2820 [Acididesulfobacillus acetoxydans]
MLRAERGQPRRTCLRNTMILPETTDIGGARSGAPTLKTLYMNTGAQGKLKGKTQVCAGSAHDAPPVMRGCWGKFGLKPKSIP